MSDTATPATSHAEPTAVIGRRVAQFIVDYLIVGAVLAAALSLFLLAETDDDGAVEPNGLFWLITAAYIVLALGWSLWVWVFRPTRHGGRTYGMQVLGLRVERIDGQKVTAGTMAIRWLLLVVDLLLSGLVGLIAMIATRRHQRLGDLAAGTVVVRY